MLESQRFEADADLPGDDARVRRALDRVPCASRLTNLLSASVEKAGPQSLVTVGGARVSALDGLKGAPMRIALRCRFGSLQGGGQRRGLFGCKASKKAAYWPR